MPRITFVHPNGRRETFNANAGTSVKDCALDNGVAGIIAECGGAAMCATCHVYVDNADLLRAGSPAPLENDMLEMVAAERRPSSRLACQLALNEQLDGIVVHVPETQI